ncbi:MAG: ATP-binding protein [Candidatus Caldatribacteriota bacterium]|nr:ATP-binding protein [Candidatus Caldatribacteriota bacterium]
METQNIEYKPSWRDEYLKVVVAFANKDGGELIIGVDDNGNPIGVKKSKKLLEDIPNKIRNKLGIIPSVRIEKVGDKDIIHIFINPSSVSISHNGKSYIRSGSNNFELKGEELTNFLIEKSGKTWDEFVEEKAGFDDIDLKTIDEFKKYAVDRIPSIVAEKDYQTILEKLNLQADKKLKKAAILLFGKNPQRFYPAAYLKIGKFLTETDIQSSDIVDGNLFEQITNALEILRSKYLISIIKFEGIHRREILEYPYEALREAIINALIHRNYIGASSIQIRVYNDRLVIMNEGKLPPEVPVEKLKTEHLSKPRNTLLADVFYKAGFVESWGRGTIKIMEKCQEQGLPEPDFEEEHGVMKVVFYKDKFTEENLKKLGLNERQIKAVMYVKEKSSINLSSFKTIVSEVSEKTLYRDLQGLVNKGILKELGEKKGRKYELL